MVFKLAYEAQKTWKRIKGYKLIPHVLKGVRKEAHRRFKTALEQNPYEDAYLMLKEFENMVNPVKSEN